MCPGGGPVLGCGPRGVGQPRAAASANEAARGLSQDVCGALLCGEYYRPGFQSQTKYYPLFLRQKVGCEISFWCSIPTLGCSATAETSNDMKVSPLKTHFLKSLNNYNQSVFSLLPPTTHRLAYSVSCSVPAVITLKIMV